MSSETRSAVLSAACARAAFSLRHSCHGPAKKCAPPGASSSTAVVTASRNQRSWATRITAAFSVASSLLQPLEALDVEVVRRLVEEQEVGLDRERAGERGARQLAAGEASRAAAPGRRPGSPGRELRASRARARPSRPRARAATGRPSSGEACPRRGRRLHRALEPCAARPRARAGRARPETTYSRSVRSELARRALVVERDARALRERELAALERDLARDRAQQRRLARAVRAREREPVAAPDREGHALEERVPGELLAEAGCDQHGHRDRRVERGEGRKGSATNQKIAWRSGRHLRRRSFMRVYHSTSIMSGGLLLGLVALLLLFTHAASGAPEKRSAGIPNARGIFTGCYTIGTGDLRLIRGSYGLPPGRTARDLEPSRSDRASRTSRCGRARREQRASEARPERRARRDLPARRDSVVHRGRAVPAGPAGPAAHLVPWARLARLDPGSAGCRRHARISRTPVDLPASGPCGR